MCLEMQKAELACHSKRTLSRSLLQNEPLIQEERLIVVLLFRDRDPPRIHVRVSGRIPCASCRVFMTVMTRRLRQKVLDSLTSITTLKMSSLPIFSFKVYADPNKLKKLLVVLRVAALLCRQVYQYIGVDPH